VFSSIVKWIREKVNSLFSKKSISDAIGVDPIISTEMANKITDWGRIYSNDSPWLSDQVKSLNLGAAVSNEMARLVTIEMKSEIQGSARADFLNETYKKFLEDIRVNTEYSLAKGGGVFKPYVNGDKLCIDFIQADYFFPITFNSEKEITEAVFLEQIIRQVGYTTKYYNKLEYHKFLDGQEYISNSAFMSDSATTLGKPIELETVPEWAGLAKEVTITNVKRPLFAYFRNPMANTIEPGNPVGVSVFSRAVDQIEEADRQWSRFLWENKSGERALYTDVAAWKKNADGTSSLPDIKLYKTLETEEQNFFHDWTPELRNDSLLFGLDAILKKIEFNCGLAYGTISDPQSEDKTATEVRQSKQRSYSTVVDIQKSLQNALEHTIYIMDVMTTLYGLAPAGTYKTSYEWDDSIVADREREFTERMMLKDTVLNNWEVRMWYLGEDEATAKANVPKMPTVDDNFA
jgi:A118 family predicted phage portal protein